MAGKYLFKLHFNKKAIREWAERYAAEYDQDLEAIIAPQIKARGYFMRACPLIDKLY